MPSLQSILKRQFKGKGKEKEVHIVTPTLPSSSQSSPIPEVYNTPREEQELLHLLKVLHLDDITPEGFCIPLEPHHHIFTRTIYIAAVFKQVIPLDWTTDRIARRIMGSANWTASQIRPPPPHPDPHNPPVFERPHTTQYQGTVFVNRNVNAFLPETFLNQTVYFYNSSDDHHPQRVAVTSTWVYYCTTISAVINAPTNSTSAGASTNNLGLY
jgi:hypothetical protein